MKCSWSHELGSRHVLDMDGMGERHKEKGKNSEKQVKLHQKGS